jgi:hypothetical protein
MKIHVYFSLHESGDASVLGVFVYHNRYKGLALGRMAITGFELESEVAPAGVYRKSRAKCTAAMAFRKQP